MKLLTILPIARGIRTETLTYFSSEDIPLGAIVSVPIRKKVFPGIIIESKNALEAKAEIKEMDFAIKKIIRHKDDTSLPRFLMEGVLQIAKDTASSKGAILAALVPKIALQNPEIFERSKKHKNSGAVGFDTLAIQSPNADRFDMYRSIIRESFAKKLSIAIICPTEEDVPTVSSQLSKGIEKYTSKLANAKSKKVILNWKKEAENDHSMLLVGTANMLALLPENVGTIILENESSQFYKQRRAPFLDLRSAARELARGLGARIIYGDKLLSIETIAKVKEGKTQEYARLAKRNTYKIQTLLVDTKPKETENKEEKKEFKALSPDLEEMIRYAEKSNKKLFIYSARRGISAQTVCRDCGTTVLCEKCEAPAVLHTRGEEKVFICHHCGVSRDALLQCINCQSWNLFSYGIGIERIEEEIKKLTDINIARIDSDTTKTAKEAKLKIEKFLSIKGGILLGTDLAIRFLPDESVDFSAIPSVDSLASLPDFRTNERVMHTILEVKAKARECMLLQSRNPQNKIIEQALSGDLEGFIRDEISARKQFGYPPFTKIIKLTVAGKKPFIRADAQIVANKLAKYNPTIFPAFIKAIKGEVLLHIMIKIPNKDWPSTDLSDILLSLPPSVRIDTSPQSLL